MFYYIIWRHKLTIIICFFLRPRLTDIYIYFLSFFLFMPRNPCPQAFLLYQLLWLTDRQTDDRCNIFSNNCCSAGESKRKPILFDFLYRELRPQTKRMSPKCLLVVYINISLRYLPSFTEYNQLLVLPWKTALKNIIYVYLTFSVISVPYFGNRSIRSIIKSETRST